MVPPVRRAPPGATPTRESGLRRLWHPGANGRALLLPLRHTLCGARDGISVSGSGAGNGAARDGIAVRDGNAGNGAARDDIAVRGGVAGNGAAWDSIAVRGGVAGNSVAILATYRARAAAADPTTAGPAAALCSLPTTPRAACPKITNRTWFWIAVPVVGLAIVVALGWIVFNRLAPLFRPEATPTETVQQQPGETLPTAELPPTAIATAIPTTEAPLQTAAAPTATVALTPGPTATPCLPDAKYVADLTIPDNEKIAPGAAFTKSWRVRSTGCAAWSAGTELVFVDGERLEAPASVAVPATAPESTADISVDMRAPTAPGTYRSTWQLRGPDGVFFGGRIYAQIVVPGPLTISFVADRTTVKQGQCATLSWQVENAVSILINGKEVAAQGSSVECPPATTGFELTAKDIQGNWKRATLIINVETGY